MHLPEINTIAIIGAGTMGRGIAYASCLGGFQTKLYDVTEEILIQAGDYVRAAFHKAVAKGLVTDEFAARALAGFQTTALFENALPLADFVIEAVPEKIDMKIDLFTRLDRQAPKHAVLATNTSTLSITEMAGGTQRPRQVVGMHFFNPVPLMKLVEIIRGLETDEATVEITKKIALAMGKDPVVINESPGFITTRINAMIGNEAFYMLQEGVASAEEIDKALKLGLNHPMGPFELVDLVGLDTRLHILNFLHQTLGEKFRPSPLLVKYVKAGRLGRKAGRGVYDYSGK